MNCVHLVVELGQNLVVSEQVHLITIELERKSTVFGQQHLVTDLHGNGDVHTIAGKVARANSKNFAFVGLGDVRLRQENATSGLRNEERRRINNELRQKELMKTYLGLGKNSSDQDTISERNQLLQGGLMKQIEREVRKSAKLEAKNTNNS